MLTRDIDLQAPRRPSQGERTFHRLALASVTEPKESNQLLLASAKDYRFDYKSERYERYQESRNIPEDFTAFMTTLVDLLIHDFYYSN